MTGRDAGGTLGRRGLLAGAAALVAGGLARLGSAGRAEAAHDSTTPYSPDGVLHARETNATGAGTTSIAGGSLFPIFTASNDSVGAAIEGRAASGTAMRGRTNGAARSAGVEGSAPNGALGVAGNAGAVRLPSRGGIGVFGTSSLGEGVGVFGGARPSTSDFPVPPGRFGVVGVSDTGTGVRGDSTGGNGVFGVSSNATGAFGFSNNSFGAAGVSNAGVGVFARSSSNWGLHAESPVFAGVFSGSVFVNGNFTVANGAKSAAVRNKRGEHRRVYCQESTEAWFEDFGEATLKDGRAEVALDPEFDAVVKGDDYRVFLTELGDCGGLFVSRKGPHRFEVRSRGGSAASGSFDYRIVARRLDDVGRRLEKLDAPDFSKATRPILPPDLPTAPDERGRPRQ